MLNNRFIKLFFFGNYFYGICAVALCVETNFLQGIPPGPLSYYLITFSVSVLFYTQAYIKTEVSVDADNLRARWYLKNRKQIIISQIILTVITLPLIFLFFRDKTRWITFINWPELIVSSGFPVLAMMYYFPGRKKNNLRNVGWLKPFIIGFIWSGFTNFYPLLFSRLSGELTTVFNTSCALQFFINFMFISVLCILFDIKDYTMDYNHSIKTFVVNKGLRNTLAFVVTPLTIFTLGINLLFYFEKHYNFASVLVNTLPYFATLLVTYSLQKRKSIFYYLIIIDGIMLIKALCGIVVSVYFNY